MSPHYTGDYLPLIISRLTKPLQLGLDIGSVPA